MYVRHVELEGPGPPIPAWQVSPDVAPAAGAALFHSYGSCKEAMLGLALTLAGAGLVCTVPDLPGHGEHPEVFGPSVLDEARAAVQHARSYGSAVAVGHSLGGRLALLSGADAVVAVSPALPQQPSPEGMYALRTFATPKVRHEHAGEGGSHLHGEGPAQPSTERGMSNWRRRMPWTAHASISTRPFASDHAWRGSREAWARCRRCWRSTRFRGGTCCLGSMLRAW